VTFEPAGHYEVGLHPVPKLIDLDGDGRLDLVTANGGTHDVSIRYNQGDGTFGGETRLPVGIGPNDVIAADLDGDGRPDLVTANVGSNDLSVLLARPDGSFAPAQSFGAGRRPKSVAAGDFDGDGRLDLVAATGGRVSWTGSSIPGEEDSSNDLAFLAGRGDGTFDAVRHIIAASSNGAAPFRVAAADLDADGRLDLITQTIGPTYNSEHQPLTTLLRGRGDGTFQGTTNVQATGSDPRALVTADFNGDGHIDIVTAQLGSEDLTVFLGRGEGSFDEGGRVAVGGGPVAMVAADFNADGRPDLALANRGQDEAVILYGVGSGSFAPPVRLAADAGPTELVAGDFNADGRVDLAVGAVDSSEVLVFLAQPSGTFAPALGHPVANSIVSLAAGDFDSDGRLDLAVGNRLSPTIAILQGRGDGHFRDAGRYSLFQGDPAYLAQFWPTDLGSHSLVTGDFDGDGLIDIVAAVSGYTDPKSLILRGQGDGSFRGAEVVGDFGAGKIHVGTGLIHSVPNGTLLATDLDGDGDLDLIQPDDFEDGSVAQTLEPHAMAAADFDGDGLPDLAFLGERSNLIVQLNRGAGRFVERSHSAGPRAVPLRADFNGDGLGDIAVVNRGGQVQLRLGRAGELLDFDPPTVLNPDRPASDLALVETIGGTILAAVDALDDSVTIYEITREGGVRRSEPIATGRIPSRIAAADLDGDGAGDLAVLNALDGTVSLLRGDGRGGFAAIATLVVGLSATEVDLADVDGDGRIDILASRRDLGQVRLFTNAGDLSFGAPRDLRAGDAYVPSSGAPVSEEQTAGVVAGRFDDDASPDLITLNPGSRTVGLLRGIPGGGFADPIRVPVDELPRRALGADLDDDGRDELIVLGPDGVVVYRLEGNRLVPVSRFDTGLDPTGISAADLDADGNLDLLMGNELGDVLILRGLGDGTFAPQRKAESEVALAVADLDGDGANDFVFGNATLDRVSVLKGDGSSSVLAGRSDGLIAPGAVKLADLNGDRRDDLVVANSGSNNVLVYPGLGDGRFGTALNAGHGYFTGTSPAGVTIADVDADGRPDLVVANRGSNDVTVLLNRGANAAWTFDAGPRLQAGTGPVSSVVQDVTADGLPDLIVSANGADAVSVLPGVGGGFFDDRAALSYPVGDRPGEIFLGEFDDQAGPDLISLNSGSNDLSFIPGIGLAPLIDIRPDVFAGLRPSAGIAGDFNSDGRSDLLVAYGGEGRYSLLFGSQGGPVLGGSLTSDEASSPTSIALASLGSNAIDFYVSSSGREAAVLLSMAWSSPKATEPGATPPVAGDPFAPSNPPGGTLVDPLLPGHPVETQDPVGGSLLAVVVTLLNSTVSLSADEAILSLTPEAGALAGFLPSLGQAGFGARTDEFGEETDGDEQDAHEQDPESNDGDEPGEAIPAATPLAELDRFLYGLDEAIEEGRLRLRHLIDSDEATIAPGGNDRALDETSGESTVPHQGGATDHRGVTELRSHPVAPRLEVVAPARIPEAGFDIHENSIESGRAEENPTGSDESTMEDQTGEHVRAVAASLMVSGLLLLRTWQKGYPMKRRIARSIRSKRSLHPATPQLD
jgi:hypothetical protein